MRFPRNMRSIGQLCFAGLIAVVALAGCGGGGGDEDNGSLTETLQTVDSRNISGIAGSDKVPLTVDSADDLVQANWLMRRLRESKKTITLDNVLTLAREWRATNPVENKGRVL